MKRLIISESEKNSILMNHIHHGYNTILEQEEEIIVKDHDKNWDYKKVGDEYFTKKKTSNKWIKPTGSALEAIKSKVKFPDKPTEQPKQETNPEQPKQETNPEQPKQETKPEDTKRKKRPIPCDTFIDSIAYKGIDGKDHSDTSLIDRNKWKEFFGIKMEETNNNGLKAALRQLKKDSDNNVKKAYVFRDLKIPFNIISNNFSLEEESCCVLIKRANIANYDFNKTDTKNEDTPTTVLDNYGVYVLIKGGDNIEKVDCGGE